MALISTYRRLGEPVVVACGPSRVRGGLHVGLLFIAPALKNDFLTLTDGSERVTVSIPHEYQDLPNPKWVANVTLKEHP